MKEELKNFYTDQIKRNDQIANLSEGAKLRVKDKIFSNLGTQISAGPVSAWSKLTSNKFSHILFKGYVLAPLLVIIFIAGTTIASANALPGDTLYPVKRQVENARLLIAPTEEAKLDLEVNFAQKRLDEAEKLHSNDDVDINMEDDSDDQQVNDKTDADSGNDQIENKNNHNNDNNRNQNNRSINKNSGNFGRSDNSGSNNSREQTKQDNSGHDNQTPRQIKARQEADQALNFLNEARKNWQQKGNDQKAKQIEDRIQQFRSQVKNRLNDLQGHGGDSGNNNNDSHGHN